MQLNEKVVKSITTKDGVVNDYITPSDFVNLKFEGGGDELMLEIYKYVFDRLTYFSAPGWKKPLLVHQELKGNCVNGVNLIVSIARGRGLECFSVIGFNKDNKPHSWVLYKRQGDGAWICLDWCWKPKVKNMSEFLCAEGNMMYPDYLFMFNESECFLNKKYETFK